MSRTKSEAGGDRAYFLRASRDIEYVKQHGRRVSSTLFNLLVCPFEADACRVGIIVGKRFGIAVRRNRAKRLFRELTRHVRKELNSGYAVLVFPKREALGVTYGELRDTWLGTLKRLGIVRVGKP